MLCRTGCTTCCCSGFVSLDGLRTDSNCFGSVGCVGDCIGCVVECVAGCVAGCFAGCVVGFAGCVVGYYAGYVGYAGYAGYVGCVGYAGYAGYVGCVEWYCTGCTVVRCIFVDGVMENLR